jgi:hypothetical protein
MKLTTPPTSDEIARAINAGVPVRFGYPVSVERPELGEVWTLNLAAAYRGDADPWIVTRTAGKFIEVESANDVGMSIAGMAIGPNDVGLVRKAMRLIPPPGTRHDPEEDSKRLAAGRIVMEIEDTMVRANMLDAVDGWAAIYDHGTVIDSDPKHGVLIEPKPELQLKVRILIVKCPSTGRRYSLKVPQTMNTAKEARLWTLHGIDPEVES